MQILSKFCHNKHLTRHDETLFKTILSSRVILPSQCTNVLLFNSATFIKETGRYSQKYYKLKG